MAAGLTKKRKQQQLRPSEPAPNRLLVYGTLPLRLYLGATFVYAGFQKIADPGFLAPGSATYIGTQLQSFALHSPIAFLIDVFALPSPQLTGIAVIAAEITIGSFVLAGIATRWAAAAGALVNLVFFLTASWTVQPYFLGSDSIYAVAWITLAIVGDQGIFSARPLLFGAMPPPNSKQRAVDEDRRRFLMQLGGVAVGAIWVLGVLPRVRQSAIATLPSSTPSATPTPIASPTGTRVGNMADLQSQTYLEFQDPKSGDPAVAVQLSGGSVVAFDAVCTHAGCQVSYDKGQHLLACPCHGALFDPAHGASVVSGPAPTPLQPIPIQVGADGGVYAD